MSLNIHSFSSYILLKDIFNINIYFCCCCCCCKFIHITVLLLQQGHILTLPMLLEDYVPPLDGLPMYVLRLATEVSRLYNHHQELSKLQITLHNSSLYNKELCKLQITLHNSSLYNKELCKLQITSHNSSLYNKELCKL